MLALPKSFGKERSLEYEKTVVCFEQSNPCEEKSASATDMKMISHFSAK